MMGYEKLYGGLLIAGVLAIGIYMYESKISSLEEEIEELRGSIELCVGSKAVETANNSRLRAEIDDMNKATEALGSKYTALVEKYQALEKQPAEVRYEVLYKYITQEKSNECKDIKSAIDGVSNYINDRMR